MFTYYRSTERKAQSFTPYSDDFYLNEDEELVKKDIPRDDQAYIESFFDTRLEKILDIYSDQIGAGNSPWAVSFSDEVVTIDGRKSDLDKILEADATIDQFRLLHPELAHSDRSVVINAIRHDYESKIKAYNEKMKGGNPNEAAPAQPEG